MEWPQFFNLLRSVFTKEEPEVEPTDDNFPIFLVNRYISFAHPNLCIYIDEMVNRNDKAQFLTDPKTAYYTLRAILPKLPYTRINYVKKTVSEQAHNKGVSDDQLKHLADLLEVSKREILLYTTLV